MQIDKITKKNLAKNNVRVLFFLTCFTPASLVVQESENHKSNFYFENQAALMK